VVLFCIVGVIGAAIDFSTMHFLETALLQSWGSRKSDVK